MSLIEPDTCNKLKKFFESQHHVVILTHVNPDGDAIGSLLGLYWYLKIKGCSVAMATPNAFPRFLKWMDGAGEILDFSRKQKRVTAEIKKAGLIFFMDLNEPDRLGGIKGKLNDLRAWSIMVDHHPEPAGFTETVISNTEYSSTAELVYQLICDLGDKNLVDERIAECLFTGIMTDTGCFSYNSSRPKTYRRIAELLEKGIDKDRIYRQVYENYSAGRLRLLGYSLKDKMVVIPDLRTAYISLTAEDLRQYSHQTGDTEGFVNFPFSIGDIRVTALFLEKKDRIKISFRSKGKFEINKFAQKYFNGGGHMNAAGGEYRGTMEESLASFEERITEYADEIRNLP